MLLPFSAIYWIVIRLRNEFFDRDWIKSAKFNFPIICVGNIAVGGTGKTPMTEYLIRLLKNQFNTATLSRGYKRKTKGFGIADANSSALEIGDEPMQFHLKFPEVTVAVGEERLVAIPQLLHDKSETEVIILDDAFQHRYVQAGLNIILTEYKNLYTRDFVLPGGDLRDIRRSAKRAQIIVVSKCKPDLSETEKQAIIQEIKPLPHQQLFFTTIEYGIPYALADASITKTITEDTDVLLICGIANPRPLKAFITAQTNSYDLLKFPDHHIFSIDDLEDIKLQFNKMNAAKKIILTTEKDGVRLMKFQEEIKLLPIFVIPIKHKFLFDEGAIFDDSIVQYIASFEKINRTINHPTNS
jgi:tetraacyldisaccharide 4'-kinase